MMLTCMRGLFCVGSHLQTSPHMDSWRRQHLPMKSFPSLYPNIRHDVVNHPLAHLYYTETSVAMLTQSSSKRVFIVGYLFTFAPPLLLNIPIKNFSPTTMNYTMNY